MRLSMDFSKFLATPEEGKVNSPSIAYNAMAERWKLPNDLLGGTRRMRNKREEWLPRETKEEMSDYEVRLSRSFLFNGYADTLDKHAAKPFSRPVIVKGELPERLEPIADDVDRTGKNLTQLGREAFTAAEHFGLTHILVDFPQTIRFRPDGQRITLADERRMNARASLTHIIASQLIGWTTTTALDGSLDLTSIRILEMAVVNTGRFRQEQVPQIRIITKDGWQIHLWDPKEEDFFAVAEGPHTFGAVPLVTIYFSRDGFLTALPPFEDLAWANLEHWQSSSDQRNILRFARTGVWFGKGFPAEKVEKNKLTVGPNKSVLIEDSEGDLKVVEHSGKAIGAGQEDINRIEQRMELLGMAPLMRITGNLTATGIAIDEAKTKNTVQAWVRATEGGIMQALEFAGQWTNEQIPDDVAVQIFNDFGVALRHEQDITALDKMHARGAISDETFLNENKRRGVLSEDLDVEEELERVENQAPKIPLVPMDDEEEDETTPPGQEPEE